MLFSNQNNTVVLLGWMLDESTFRSTNKMCIVYVRYIDGDEPKTAYYGLLDLQDDATANNIVKNLNYLWDIDDLQPMNSYWLSTDNASTFTGKFNTIRVMFLRIRRILI